MELLSILKSEEKFDIHIFYEYGHLMLNFKDKNNNITINLPGADALIHMDNKKLDILENK